MKSILSFFEGFNEFCYVVEDGEHLIDIAFKFCVSLADLIALNNLKEEVFAGQIIYIKRGEYLAISPENFNADYSKLLEKNNKKVLYPFDVLKK